MAISSHLFRINRLKVHCFLVLFLVVLPHFGRNEIPSYIKVCKSSDPELASCIIESVNQIRSKLKDGIPELDVPPLEPLYLDEVKLRSGPSSAKINANITNIKVWGPSSFKIKEMKLNIRKNRFAFRVFVPDLYFKGDYDIDMNVLLLRYKGQGPITGNFTNYEFTCLLKGTKVQRIGQTYLEFDKMLLTLYLGKSHIYLGNLFRDDPVIARAINDVVSDNTDIFINEIKPALENALSIKFLQIANKITKAFTYAELFP